MDYRPKSSIEEIIVYTQKFLPSYDPDLVRAVIMHLFEQTRKYLEYPTHATLLIRSLGRLVPSYHGINFNIRKIISKIREGKYTYTPKLKAIIAELWRRRRLAQQFESQFKFSKRYSSWHYKHKDPLN